MLHPVDIDLLNFFLFSDKLTPESMVEEQRQAEENRGYMQFTKQAGSQRDGKWTSPHKPQKIHHLLEE